jgi:hypothetical protein
MESEILSTLDFDKRDEPATGTDMRKVLTDWLEYQRGEFLRKLRDLGPRGLVEWSIPPVELSVLGLVRHMQQMEHGYLTWGLGGGDRDMTYGDDDYAGGSVETVDVDLRLYLAEVDKADAAISSMPSLDTPGAGHGRPLGGTLVKMVDEYALHSGQAHMLRYAALGEIIR